MTGKLSLPTCMLVDEILKGVSFNPKTHSSCQDLKKKSDFNNGVSSYKSKRKSQVLFLTRIPDSVGILEEFQCLHISVGKVENAKDHY